MPEAMPVACTASSDKPIKAPDWRRRGFLLKRDPNGSFQLARPTMDAKANTQICRSPCFEAAAETQLGASPSVYMIVVSGGIPGTMLPLSEQSTTLGRSADTTFQLDDLTVSRQHALVSVDSAGGVHISDEGSANGTFVNGDRIARHCPRRLEDGDRVQLGTTVVLKLVRLDPRDERFQRELFERSVRDPLTGLYNRGYFLSQIGVLAARGAAQEVGLAVLMLDIDHFKRVNDQYGHLAGDGVLREVAAVIRESTRAEDLVARYGGEEFVIALPVSVPELATERAERIRGALADRRIDARDDEIQVTASLGLSFGPPGRARQTMALLQTADQALYQAKADGRNRVVFLRQPLQSIPRTSEAAAFKSGSSALAAGRSEAPRSSNPIAAELTRKS
jgi:diguanylate cyclase (GGDEF)-like protein